MKTATAIGIDPAKQIPKRFFPLTIGRSHIWYKKTGADHFSKTLEFLWKRMNSLEYKAYTSYTIVTTIYSRSLYLDNFFSSLINQTIGFKKNLFVVAVDDGATYNSAEIVHKWQTRYPNNIKYVHKDYERNARNIGLDHVKTPWVTLPDSDDFLDINYFKTVDIFLKKYQKAHNIAILDTRHVEFLEQEGEFRSKQQLDYRFYGKKYICIKNIGQNIINTPTSAFFESRRINNNHIRFNEKLGPRFEDGTFCIEYLLSLRSESVGFVDDAIYYQRKINDKSSLQNFYLTHSDRFSTMLKEGYFPLIQKISTEQKLPEFIEYYILLELIWHMLYVVNMSEMLDFLSDTEKEVYYDRINKYFTYLNPKTICKFRIGSIKYFHQVGMLNLFKNLSAPAPTVFIEGYDSVKNQILLRHYFRNDEDFTYYICEKKVKPAYMKTIRHNFIGRAFCMEKHIWLPCPFHERSGLINKICSKSEFMMSRLLPEKVLWFLGKSAKDPRYITVQRNGKPVKLELNNLRTKKNLFSHTLHELSSNKIFHSLRKLLYVVCVDKLNKAHRERVPLANIAFVFSPERVSKSNPFRNCWLLMDRNTLADDNAEHFYRYLKREHPQEDIYFILEMSSPAWSRLQEEGFRLIAFGSPTFENALRGCSKIISSHFSRYFFDYFKDGSLLRKQHIFLQHGVIKDDLSHTFRGITPNLVITTTKREYESIISNDSNYKLCEKEVAMTGLARHDALFDNAIAIEKNVLIFPTWRNTVTGKVHRGNHREYNQEFVNSEYATNWMCLLKSDMLKRLGEAYDYSFSFFPHANIDMYVDDLDLPSHIAVYRNNEVSIQSLFRRASILITDYSSVAMDFALLKKPLLYYQFDRDSIYQVHLYRKGYFDYASDGFGPVVTNVDGAMTELELLFKRSGKIDEIYESRIEKFFTFFDQKNCERIYRAVKKLDISYD